MAILYALVARGKTVLAEFTSTSGNFPTVTRFLLARIGDRGMPHGGGEAGGQKMSIVYDQHVFHYVVDSSGGGQGQSSSSSSTSSPLIYLCMVDDAENKRRLAFLFLEEVQRRFMSTFGEAAYTAIAFAMNESFSPSLKAMMDFYNADPSADNLRQLRTKIDDTKSVMVENIDQVLARGEKIELLVDKTDRLSQQAVQFKRQSRRLQQSMWWRRLNRSLLLAFVLSLAIFLFTALGCGGFDFHRCKK
ncbi:r-vamp71-family [Nannochloropsis oceanica]